MGLNLVAVAEPYFQSTLYLRILQFFNIIAAQILLMPFYLYVGYRISRAVISGIAVRIPGWVTIEGENPSKQNSRDTTRKGVIARPWFPGPLFGFVNSVGESLAGAADGLLDFVPRTALRLLRVVGSLIRRLCRRGARLALCGYLAGSVAFVSLETFFFLSMVIRAAAHPNGAFTFYSTCGQCHYRFRPFNYNLTAGIWEETVERMSRHAAVTRTPFPSDKQGDLIRFLKAVRSYSDRRLLRSKCYTCHIPFRMFERMRTRSEWGLIIDRIRKRNPFYITPRQAEQLVEYLSSRKKWTRKDPEPGTREFNEFQIALSFEKKCGICHTLDILFLPHIGLKDWEEVLIRMGGKEPDMLSPTEALSFRPLIEENLMDRSAFLSRYPHAKMREQVNE